MEAEAAAEVANVSIVDFAWEKEKVRRVRNASYYACGGFESFVGRVAIFVRREGCDLRLSSNSERGHYSVSTGTAGILVFVQSTRPSISFSTEQSHVLVHFTGRVGKSLLSSLAYLFFNGTVTCFRHFTECPRYLTVPRSKVRNTSINNIFNYRGRKRSMSKILRCRRWWQLRACTRRTEWRRTNRCGVRNLEKRPRSSSCVAADEWRRNAAEIGRPQDRSSSDEDERLWDTHKALSYVLATLPSASASSSSSSSVAGFETSSRYSPLATTVFHSLKYQRKGTLSDPKLIAAYLERRTGSKGLALDYVEGTRTSAMTQKLTPYQLALIDYEQFQTCPVRKQFLPLASDREGIKTHPMLLQRGGAGEELNEDRFVLDSLSERQDAPTPGIVRRYHDKALFLATSSCPTYCRFCTRSYGVGKDPPAVAGTSFSSIARTRTDEKYSDEEEEDKARNRRVYLSPRRERWERCLAYLREETDIADVVLSGGDCFSLSSEQIFELGKSILKIPHIRRLRFGTKGLAALPMKLVDDTRWVDALTRVVNFGRERFQHVCVHTHINTPIEVTTLQTRRAMRVLFDRGITVRNQAVLLRGVNVADIAGDARMSSGNGGATSMIELNRTLGDVQIEPYYVYLHDSIAGGSEDLKTSLVDLIRLEEKMRGRTAGFNTPTCVVDLPGGGGKRLALGALYYDPVTSGVACFRGVSREPRGRHATAGTEVDDDAERLYMHYDPLHALTREAREAWFDRTERLGMIERAISRARQQATGGISVGALLC